MNKIELTEIGAGGKRLENPDNPGATCFFIGHDERRVGNLIRCERCKSVVYKESKRKSQNVL